MKRRLLLMKTLKQGMGFFAINLFSELAVS